MHLRLIRGGLDGAPHPDDADTGGDARPTPDDVRREAARRIRALVYERARAGEPENLPYFSSLRHLKLQIEYTSIALARLRNIPADFADDSYWPA